MKRGCAAERFFPWGLVLSSRLSPCFLHWFIYAPLPDMRRADDEPEKSTDDCNISIKDPIHDMSK